MHEEFYLMGYNAMWCSESLLTFQRKKDGSACHLLHAGFLLGLFFDPEDGSDMFL
jgi:hypothetical protein